MSDERSAADRGELTGLLLLWAEGDDAALERLTPMVYGELKRLAHHYLRDESREPILQTTALVHEAYMRLVGLDVTWQGRGHFVAVSARLMRRILVDRARRRAAD
ncbi:MAG: ECF-type sigma factor, partial [Acidobacteriota bacterium]